MKMIGRSNPQFPSSSRACLYALALLLTVLTPVVGSAQTAYKGLKWGDSPQTVQKSVPDIVKDETDDKSILQMQLAMFFLHGKEFAGHTPDPTENEAGVLTSWTSQGQDTTYWFVDDRLVGVNVLFMEGGVLKSLLEKSGKLSPVTGSLPGLSLSTATWNRDSNRVVVWFQIDSHLEEDVSYFNPRWFGKLEKAALHKWRKGNVEKLD